MPCALMKYGCFSNVDAPPAAVLHALHVPHRGLLHLKGSNSWKKYKYSEKKERKKNRINKEKLLCFVIHV